VNIFDDLGDPSGGPSSRDALERVLARARRRRATRRSAFALVVVGAVAALAVGASALGAGSDAIHVEGTTTTNTAPTSTAPSPSTTSGSTSTTASTTTPPVVTSERWTDSGLTLTPTSLGSVHIGMTPTQAEAAAGVPFDGHADGAFYPTSLPVGYPHLFVNEDSNNLVSCFGAEIGDTTTPQVVTTTEGFHLGDTVQRLLAIYGSRAHFVQASAGGISPRAGYVVTEPGGRLAFYVDNSNTRILGIKGGGADLTPSSCNG